MNYHYPIDLSWSTEEIIAVVHFFTLIEQAHESRVSRSDLLKAYNEFKKVVPSKSEEKQLFKKFKKAADYESYAVVRNARKSSSDNITM